MNINMTKASELSEISKLIGQDEDIVQAGGGNTSVKLDKHYMLIKSSGYQLTEVTETNGYSVVDHNMICEYFKNNKVEYSDEQKILKDSLIEGKKPSIETFLHAITNDYTIHSHPFCVTLLAAAENGAEILKKLFPSAVIVDYATPGIKLAQKYYRAVSECSESNIIFMKNHGLVVSGASAEEALKLHTDVILKICRYLDMDIDGYLYSINLFNEMHGIDKNKIVYRCKYPDIQRAIKTGGGVWKFKFSPDCVVYCGKEFMLDNGDTHRSLKEFYEKYGLPKVVINDGDAYIIADNMTAANECESVLNFTAKLYLKDRDLVCLDDDECSFLLNWNSEKYRQNLRNSK